MWTDEEFEQLEEEEHSLTLEEILLMLLLLEFLKSDIQKELRDFYSRYGTDGVVSYQNARKHVSNKDHRSRMSVLLLFISSRFSNLLSDLEPHFNTLLSDVLSKENAFFVVDLDTDNLLFREWGVDKANWLDRLRDDVELWDYYISTDIKRGMLKRESIDDILKQLDKRFMSIGRILQRLVVTN